MRYDASCKACYHEQYLVIFYIFIGIIFYACVMALETWLIVVKSKSDKIFSMTKYSFESLYVSTKLNANLTLT